MRERFYRMMDKRARREENEREHAEDRKARKLRKKQERQKPRERVDETRLEAEPEGSTIASGRRDAVVAKRALREATVLGVDRTRVEIDLEGERCFARRHPRLVSIVAGDVVQISTAVDGAHRAEELLPRRTLLSREDPARPGRPKPVAANLDLGVVTIPADRPRWGLVERIRAALRSGGIDAAVVLTKIDMVADGAFDEQLQAFEADGLPSFAVSAVDGRGIAALRAAIAGRSCAFLGHSGAGKSSLANALDPDTERRTGAVRRGDSKGRHTTSRSLLTVLADGTRILDTPGIRAFGLVE